MNCKLGVGHVVWGRFCPQHMFRDPQRLVVHLIREYWSSLNDVNHEVEGTMLKRIYDPPCTFRAASNSDLRQNI